MRVTGGYIKTMLSFQNQSWPTPLIAVHRWGKSGDVINQFSSTTTFVRDMCTRVVYYIVVVIRKRVSVFCVYLFFHKIFAFRANGKERNGIFPPRVPQKHSSGDSDGICNNDKTIIIIIIIVKPDVISMRRNDESVFKICFDEKTCFNSNLIYTCW